MQELAYAFDFARATQHQTSYLCAVSAAQTPWAARNVRFYYIGYINTSLQKKVHSENT